MRKIGDNILESEYEIIGHPILIGDVLRKISVDNEGPYELQYDKQIDILKKRTYYNEPVEEQNEECIKYIYNLISTDDHTTL